MTLRIEAQFITKKTINYNKYYLTTIRYESVFPKNL